MSRSCLGARRFGIEKDLILRVIEMPARELLEEKRQPEIVLPI